MTLKFLLWIGLLSTAGCQKAYSMQAPFQGDDYDLNFGSDSHDDDLTRFNSNEMQRKYYLPILTRSAVTGNDEQSTENPTTECATFTSDDERTSTELELTAKSVTAEPTSASAQSTTTLQEFLTNEPINGDQETKAKELRNLIQHLYIAQARVELEATEIRRAQAVANSAQQALEEAANHVRAITAALQSAQQQVASAAIRAQTAQLQLAAHDQLLFAARQDVDALSSQMVGLQAAEGISQPKITVDLSGLLKKLKQPLQGQDKPTPVPTILQNPTQTKRLRLHRFQVQQQISPKHREHKYIY